MIRKILTFMCLILIVLVIFNWFTGLINPVMTSGAYVIVLTGLSITMFNLIKVSNKKN